MTKCLHFPYGQTEQDYLCAADNKLATVIRQVGKIEREINLDVFAALISSIIAQQISGRAAAAVTKRVCDKTGGLLTPESLVALPEDELKACGLSGQKVRYIRQAAQAAIDGVIDFAGLKKLSDEEIIRQLTALPGVGRWTAEMLLVFSLARPDVISYNDFGIRKGLQILYGTEKITKKDFDRLTAAYHPYATAASFYLWHIANNNWQP